MKKRPCNYKECSSRRIHHERPDEPRGIQYVEVPDDFPLEGKTYCSFTCAIMDGSYDLKKGWINKGENNGSSSNT